MTELELKVCQIVREIAGLETFAIQMDLNNAFNVEIPIEKFSLCENIDSI